MRAADEPVVENVYRLQIMNTQEAPREFSIGVSGLEGIELESETQPIRVQGASNRLVPVRVRAPRGALTPGSHRIQFTIEARDAQARRPPDRDS